MIYLTFIIPILTIVALLLFFRSKVTLVGYAIILFPSILFTFLLNTIMVHSRTYDTEYLGSHIVKVKHYDEWDEWITQTCTRECCCTTDSDGKKTCGTETYDCSYRDYHPEYWVMVDNYGREYYISHDMYLWFLKRYNKPEIFVDMDRDYYTIDGDMQYVDWPQTIETSYSLTRSSGYTNKVQAAHSIFKIEDLKEEEVKKLKLNDYPEVDNYVQTCIIGMNVSNKVHEKFNYINGVYGPRHQFRTFIFVFKNKPMDIAYKQRSHFEGGNKNEFIICIGIDSLTNKITWAKTFSWMDVPELGVETEQYIISQDKLDLNKLGDHLLVKVPKLWKRKHFRDFDYLKIEVTTTQLDIIILILFLYNIGASIFLLYNEDMFRDMFNKNNRW